METFPIAITGMHRTGTSMVTRALHDSGLRLLGDGEDEFIDAAEDNPEGFWENKAIVACNEDLLEAAGGAWDNPPAFPPQGVDDPRVTHVAAAATEALAGLRQHARWGFKDPRTCLTAAFWLDLEPELRFVVCVRHPLEVALSLKRRNQNSYSLGLALWERYYATLLDLVPRERRIVTHYDTYFTDPQGELARLCEFAGLEPAPPRVRDDLRHHTVGVTLNEADVSPTVRELYAGLCREAGLVLPPEPRSDEGRVRRLILDGAVAARHAEQRQAAIDRLQERERLLRAEHDERVRMLRAEHVEREQELRTHLQVIREERQQLDADHRARIRELEATVRDLHERIRKQEEAHRNRVRDLEIKVATTKSEAEARVSTIQAEATKAVQELTSAVRATADVVARTEQRVATIDERTTSTAARVEVAVRGGPTERSLRLRAGRLRARVRARLVDPARRAGRAGRRVAAPAAKAATRRLPVPAQKALRRSRALVRDPRRQALPTARAVARRLPPPARGALSRGRTAVQDSRRLALPRAKAAARRLPPPAQQALRKARALLTQGSPPPKKQRPRPQPVKRVSAPPAPPKGPAIRQWRAGYERLVDATVPADRRWLVAVPGSPPHVVLPRSTPFPAATSGRPFADDLAHVGHLEALRYDGHDLLVVPEGSRPWLAQQAELREHLTATYRLVTDQPDAGLVFDLRAPAEAGTRSLRAEVNGLAATATELPTVLDWTSAGVADELPGFTVFQPPASDTLPYVDRSVDIVVTEPSRDAAEAARVAVLGVVTVERANGGAAEVRAVAAAAERPVTGVRTLLWTADPDDDAAWRDAIAERAAGAGFDVRFGPVDAASAPDVGDAEVVLVVEPYVLPMPGAIEIAAAFAAADPSAAVSGKVLMADGRLESAGGIVFSDRSIGLIGHASTEVRAPWHDYVRPVCWAPGFVAAAASLWTSVTAEPQLTGRAYVREWCSGVWATGRSVRYQPSAVAVRVKGDGGEASTPLLESAWQRVLDLRPIRPAELTDGHWRYLLAHDDVEACRA